jgi:hypothetical protein
MWKLHYPYIFCQELVGMDYVVHQGVHVNTVLQVDQQQVTKDKFYLCWDLLIFTLKFKLNVTFFLLTSCRLCFAFSFLCVCLCHISNKILHLSHDPTGLIIGLVCACKICCECPFIFLKGFFYVLLYTTLKLTIFSWCFWINDINVSFERKTRKNKIIKIHVSCVHVLVTLHKPYIFHKQ